MNNLSHLRLLTQNLLGTKAIDILEMIQITTKEVLDIVCYRYQMEDHIARECKNNP